MMERPTCPADGLEWQLEYMQQEEPRAVYLHCMAHCLNLAAEDTCRSIRIMADVFDIVLELSKMFKYSAKKKAMLLKLKSELCPETPGVKPLCATRWTVRAQSLKAFVLNYALIRSVLQMIMEDYSGKVDVTAPARGILASMESFTFLFGIMIAVGSMLRSWPSMATCGWR